LLTIAFLSVAFTMCMSYPIVTYLGRTAISGLIGVKLPSPFKVRGAGPDRPTD
jgi:hypothetical protein